MLPIHQFAHLQADSVYSVKFCGLGFKGQTERFTSDLHRAAEKVRQILDA